MSSYKETYIEQLKKAGEWDKLPTVMKEQFNEMSDAAVGEIMARSDEDRINRKMIVDILKDPSHPDFKSTLMGQAENGLTNLTEVFGGALIEGPGERLSPLGKKLFDFLNSAEMEGFGLGAAVEQLQYITGDGAFVLRTIGKLEST